MYRIVDLGVVSSESDAESMALGMNDLGQVVGWTHVSFGSGQDLVLVPIGPCDYDITRDGTVDFDDYLEVLSAWGDCPVATVCWADLDGDCAVGQSDLTIVLSHWSESCTESAQSLPSALEALMGAWLAAGGLDAIEQGMISVDALAETIGTTPTVNGVLDLFELLEDGE